MSLLTSTQGELIKTKRSAAFWVGLIGAAVIPMLFMIVYLVKPTEAAGGPGNPWNRHMFACWQSFASFMGPMFVILICSQIPQIEYKNNAWKQVFASPQSIGNIYFSKLMAILLMIFFMLVSFNIFVILAGVIPSLFHKQLHYLEYQIHFKELLRLNIKTGISLLGIIAIQYWLSLRFKNFIVPIGIGLALLIVSTILAQFQWEHIFKVPYSYPLLTLIGLNGRFPKTGFLFRHEMNSIGYFIAFAVIGFLDLKWRKERG